MGQYLDQRILNTKQDLYDALFSLLKKQTSIKVLDICKQANITPMTFYHHYGDKTQLIEDAIKNQLSLRLPIPTKLKPHNLKQFIYYLLHFLSDFCLSNKDLIISSIKYCLNKIKNSYLDIFIRTINFFINKELRLFLFDFQQITINILSDFITFGLAGLFFKRLFNNKNIEFETIKINLNLCINKYR